MGDHPSCNFRGPFTGPLNPLKHVSWGHQVFQVGQAPSGPTVIRPLAISCLVNI